MILWTSSYNHMKYILKYVLKGGRVHMWDFSWETGVPTMGTHFSRQLFCCAGPLKNGAQYSVLHVIVSILERRRCKANGNVHVLAICMSLSWQWAYSCKHIRCWLDVSVLVIILIHRLLRLGARLPSFCASHLTGHTSPLKGVPPPPGRRACASYSQSPSTSSNELNITGSSGVAHEGCGCVNRWHQT